MRAAILSIGDELILGQGLDTNSAWLAAQLAERGILTAEHRTLGDDRAAIATAITELAQRCDLLVITGGLGPTADDLTREALGDTIAPGEPLAFDADALAQIQRRFASRGRAMPEANRKQAMHPRGTDLLPNPHGTAPGLAGQLRKCLVFSLPGPPPEMQPMFLHHVAPALPGQTGAVLLTASVHAFGLGESDGATLLGALMERTRNPLVGTTVSGATLTARIRAEGERGAMQKALEETAREVERLWHPYVFGRGDQSLSDAVGLLLQQRGLRLVTAESCTGGWLGKAIVDSAGSSAYYLGGWTTYANAMKAACLGVPAALLERCGAVSAEAAVAMAEGALRASDSLPRAVRSSPSPAAVGGPEEGRSGGETSGARAGDLHADYSLAITGIAGPEGGSVAKPVGTIFIAVAQRDDDAIETRCHRFHFPGDRSAIRDRSVKAALQLLRFALLDVDDAPLLWEAP